MFFSYTLSVILLSLAIYGAWCVLRDIWQWYVEPQLMRPPGSTFLIFVRNQEEEIEDLLRYLMREMDISEVECDAVIVDCGSQDLTPSIIQRIISDNPTVHAVMLPETIRPVGEFLPLCRGSVIHILDMTTRLSSHEFMVVTCGLLRQDGREIRVQG